jgi:3-oxoacyl-[acyl-carrier protein] reductase
MRTAVITGGSRGIGAACVRAFSQAGWRVAFFYLASDEAAQALAAETGALALRADVTQSASVDAACASVLRDFRHVDALVNNAGVSLTARLQDVTDAQWRQVLDVNLTGAFYVTRALLPQMIAQKYGRIVNVASIWGMVGGSMEAAYSAAKAGLIGLTKALAKEAGPSGITVNALAPGATRTDMLAEYGEETVRQIALEAPLGRLCEPGEIASAALWLCGDGAAMVTGQVLCVSGGSVIV